MQDILSDFSFSSLMDPGGGADGRGSNPFKAFQELFTQFGYFRGEAIQANIEKHLFAKTGIPNSKFILTICIYYLFAC